MNATTGSCSHRRAKPGDEAAMWPSAHSAARFCSPWADVGRVSCGGGGSADEERDSGVDALDDNRGSAGDSGDADGDSTDPLPSPPTPTPNPDPLPAFIPSYHSSSPSITHRTRSPTLPDPLNTSHPSRVCPNSPYRCRARHTPPTPCDGSDSGNISPSSSQSKCSPPSPPAPPPSPAGERAAGRRARG